MTSPTVRALMRWLVLAAVAELAACQEPAKAPTAASGTAAPPPLVPTYVAEMKQSSALCQQMQAFLPAFYDKPQKLVARVKTSKYFNYKYLKRDATHLSFEVECGPFTFNAYGSREKFHLLENYLVTNPPQPRTLGVTVVTDKSHGNPGIFTLLEWHRPE